MKRLVSLLLSCLLLSSCGTIVTPAKTPPEHLVSEAPPAQVLPAPGEMPELLPDSQEAGGENASEPSPEEGGGTPVETLPEPQRVVDRSTPHSAWQGIPWARRKRLDRPSAEVSGWRSDSTARPRMEGGGPQRARQCGADGICVGPLRGGTGLPCRRREMMQQ